MRKKKGAVILALAMMLLLVPVMAQAGTWRQNYIGWWWQEADGSWPSNEWKVSTETGICLTRMDISVMDGTGMEQTGTIWAESLTGQ